MKAGYKKRRIYSMGQFFCRGLAVIWVAGCGREISSSSTLELNSTQQMLDEGKRRHGIQLHNHK